MTAARNPTKTTSSKPDAPGRAKPTATKPRAASTSGVKPPTVKPQTVKAQAVKRPANKSEASDNRVSPEECRRVLHHVSLFADLSDADVEQLAPLARVRELCAGSTVFYEDDLADAMYFLSEGAIEVFKSDEAGKKLPLTILRDGGVLGEMGLLTHDTRSATARTLTRTRLLMIGSQDFHNALQEGNLAAHRLVFGLARVLAERLSKVNETLFALYESENDATVRQLAASHRNY